MGQTEHARIHVVVRVKCRFQPQHEIVRDTLTLQPIEPAELAVNGAVLVHYVPHAASHLVNQIPRRRIGGEATEALFVSRGKVLHVQGIQLVGPIQHRLDDDVEPRGRDQLGGADSKFLHL